MEKKNIYVIRYVIKTYPGQPPTLAQLPAQQRKIRRKFEYFLAGRAIASNDDMTQVGYCLGLKSSARPRGWIEAMSQPSEHNSAAKKSSHIDSEINSESESESEEGSTASEDDLFLSIQFPSPPNFDSPYLRNWDFLDAERARRYITKHFNLENIREGL